MTDKKLDPLLIPVLANRLDGIVREMSNSLLRSGRSAVISTARDFSCAIVTADNQLLSSAEGLPGHIFGTQIMTEALTCLQPDMREGDCFLHNDVYMGNTHPADYGFLVPVFVDGEHVFTVCSKAHQADIGNSIPTTYHVKCRDVYEEGALVFPCVRIQKDYKNVEDIIRMCRARIRVPDQWYGDYLAAVGSVRIGESRLKELCAKYGLPVIKDFIKSWLDYSQMRMEHAISQLPSARLCGESRHDPIKDILPDGVPVRARVEVKPAEKRIEVDLTDNVDCLPTGMNMSEASAKSAVFNAIFNCLPQDIPHNSGSFRPIVICLRENCVVGGPCFPHSCSVSTTNLADRLVNAVQSAMAGLGEGYGVAEGGVGLGVGMAVISGFDPRRQSPYINRLMVTTNGGPASGVADGWVTFAIPVIAGLMYRDSVEIDEMKYPLRLHSQRLVAGTGGAGRYRGAPRQEVVYGPIDQPMTAIIPADGQVCPIKGVCGGEGGLLGASYLVEEDGRETKLPNVTTVVIRKGQKLRGVDTSGGGYGSPLARDPARVLYDVMEKWETPERASAVYGVVLDGDVAAETLRVNEDATRALRASMKQQRKD